MTIKVNHTLTKTRNPEEYGFKLQDQKGEVVHVLDDGFFLIQFKQFTIQKKITVNKKTQWVKSELQWYVHQNDLV
jgi:hypothetical protein